MRFIVLGLSLAIAGCTTATTDLAEGPPVEMSGEEWQEAAVRDPKGAVEWTSLGAEQVRAETDCFPEELVDLITELTERIGPIEITSGQRHGRGRSLHNHCKAVDFRPLNVTNQQALAEMRRLPGVGGIGSYRRNDILHMDIGPRREWRR
jgi:hypothetical protein